MFGSYDEVTAKNSLNTIRGGSHLYNKNLVIVNCGIVF